MLGRRTLVAPANTCDELLAALAMALDPASGLVGCVNARAIRVRREDGAVLDPSPMPLPCLGPIASDGRGFAMTCDKGQVAPPSAFEVPVVPRDIAWNGETYAILDSAGHVHRFEGRYGRGPRAEPVRHLFQADGG